MKKRLLALVLASAMTVGCLAACGNSGSDAGTQSETGTETAETAETAESGTDASESAETESGELKILRVSMQDPQVALDPHVYTYSYVMKPTDSVLESLLYTNDDGELELTLLEEWPEISDDMMTYSFRLKEGVMFHNGVELTSKDVKASLEHVITNEKHSMASLLEHVEGYQELLDGNAEELTGITVTGDYTFDIKLTSVYAPFLSVLSTPYCAIYPADALAEAGADWGSRDTADGTCTLYGTGPFKLESYTKEGITLVKNEDYWRGEPKLDKVIFRYDEPATQINLIKSGEIDLCWMDGDQYLAVAADPDMTDKIGTFSMTGGYFVRFNVRDVSEVQVRQALNWAIDREALCTGVLSGTATPASNLLGPGLIGHNDNAEEYTYDIEKAKQLLADAGYADGYDLTITVNTNYPTSEKLATAIQSMAKDAGFNITIEPVDQATWADRQKEGTITCSIGNWYVDYNDPESMLYPVSPGRVDGTSIFFHDAEYEQLMEEGVQTVDDAERQKIYERVDEILCHEQCAVAMLYNETKFYLLQENVSGFSVGPSFRTMFYETDIQ